MTTDDVIPYVRCGEMDE